MGILNATPDSFFTASRARTADEIRRRVAAMIDEGADIIDVGAYSTRPGAGYVDEDEEIKRLTPALIALREVDPDIPVSVDTFRANVARKAVTELGADIINDISGGNADPDMFAAVAQLHAPYILMHSRGATPAEMQQVPVYSDFITDVVADLAAKVSQLKLSGINDIILDPGFGFNKTIDLNYRLLSALEVFDIFKLPVLVGISRKSMLTKLLDITPAEALNATTAANTIALMRGAAILRVHDVKAAKEAVSIVYRSQPSILTMPC